MLVEPTRACRSTSAVADDVLDDDDDDTSDDKANSTISKVIIVCCIGFLRRLFDLCSISGSADWVLAELLESESESVAKSENLLKSTRQKYDRGENTEQH